jgi:hypothetical protein
MKGVIPVNATPTIPDSVVVDDNVAPSDFEKYLDEAILSEEEAFVRTEQEASNLQPHSLVQYRDCSRRISALHLSKPTYIGYAVTPASPLGVSH